MAAMKRKVHEADNGTPKKAKLSRQKDSKATQKKVLSKAQLEEDSVSTDDDIFDGIAEETAASSDADAEEEAEPGAADVAVPHHQSDPKDNGLSKGTELHMPSAFFTAQLKSLNLRVNL